MISDDFRGDNEHLRETIVALLELDEKDALKPHGIGGHARALLSSAYERLATGGASGSIARMNLVKSTCEVRDSRWSIHIDAADDPCNVNVRHRQRGDYYDWPEATFEGPTGTYGGICPAADRAYTMQEESCFRTRSAAMKAAHDFIRRFGAGEVEYLEWDVDSQSMVVVGHSERRHLWWKHADDTPDPLAPFFSGTDDSRQVRDATG